MRRRLSAASNFPLSLVVLLVHAVVVVRLEGFFIKNWSGPGDDFITWSYSSRFHPHYSLRTCDALSFNFSVVQVLTLINALLLAYLVLDLLSIVRRTRRNFVALGVSFLLAVGILGVLQWSYGQIERRADPETSKCDAMKSYALYGALDRLSLTDLQHAHPRYGGNRALDCPFLGRHLDPIRLIASTTRAGVEGEEKRITLKNGFVADDDMRDGAEGLLINPLYDQLKQATDRYSDKPFGAAVDLDLDRQIPFQTLERLIYTAGQTGAERIFAVLRHEHCNSCFLELPRRRMFSAERCYNSVLLGSNTPLRMCAEEKDKLVEGLNLVVRVDATGAVRATVNAAKKSPEMDPRPGCPSRAFLEFPPSAREPLGNFLQNLMRNNPEEDGCLLLVERTTTLDTLAPILAMLSASCKDDSRSGTCEALFKRIHMVSDHCGKQCACLGNP